MPPARAAIKTGQLDGYIGALESGYALEEQKEWRVITSAAPFVDDFITHVFLRARRDDPEAARGCAAFLRGWMDTIAFMKANKDKTVEITAKVINVPPSVAARAYDEQIGTSARTAPSIRGVPRSTASSWRWRAKEPPADEVMFTTQFVPVK
jgi:ABC-type nitrate/sulfonate/bicarbonate transport system substrate-binding protein